MTKIKALNKKLIFIGLTFIILLALCFSFNGNCFSTSAESEATTAVTSSDISIKGTDRKTGEELKNVGSGSFNYGSTYLTYDWRNLSHFTLSYAIADTTETHNYVFYIEHLQATPTEQGKFEAGSGIAGENIGEKEIKKFENVSDVSSLTFDYYIDADNENSHISKDYGWGIYRFSLKIDGGNAIQSLFYYVQPTNPDSDILGKLKVNYTSELSSTGWRKDFNFYIETDGYQYVDPNLIRWYVRGTSSDGKRYALVGSDIGTKDFPESKFDSAVYPKDGLFRTGSTFTFNTNEIAADWEVYCCIYDTAPNADNIDKLTPIKSTNNDEDIIKVSSGNTSLPLYVIIILACVGIIVLGAIIFIIIKSVKKEKVW